MQTGNFRDGRRGTAKKKIVEAGEQLEAGQAAKELAKELGVTDQTPYNRKSKYGGMEVADAKRALVAECRDHA
jgi:hypothetical protein